MSFTLATLKSAVQDYCETAETTFVSDLDIFIKEAEERILKNVELPVFRKTSRVLQPQATHTFLRHLTSWLLIALL